MNTLDRSAKSSQDRRIILASASPRRIQLLNNLALNFEVEPADIDETVEAGVSPQRAVQELSAHKAAAILEKLRRQGEPGSDLDLIIIAADTLVADGEEVLGKPQDREQAIDMLKQLAGKPHQVFTGVHIINLRNGKEEHYQECGATTVYFRKLQEEEIISYVDSGEPMDKAGAYALQGIGAFLVEKIDGCAANVIGLPVPLVVARLRHIGVKVMGL